MSLLDDLVNLLENQQDFDLEQTLDLILARLRRSTASEAGTIFVARPIAGDNHNQLEGFVSQNDKVDVPAERFTIPLDLTSVAGYVASTGEVVEIEDLYKVLEDRPYSFNNAFDERYGYKSTSMLAFPLKNVQGQVIGVVQLINHIGGVDENGDTVYSTFPVSEIDRVKGLATMLGALVERFDLVSEIQRLRRKIERLESES